MPVLYLYTGKLHRVNSISEMFSAMLSNRAVRCNIGVIMLASIVKKAPRDLIMLLIMTFGAMYLINALQAPPPVINANLAKQEFSALRALVHVEKIASKPHPTGSKANAEVRDYLVNTLQDLGAEVEVQRKLQSYDDKPRIGQVRFSYVENVVARFKGQASNKAILLMAHYDSKPNTAGAGDNASGVAVSLETVRAITESEWPLRNTLIVLFSDAEELGLLGSQAFFGHHRWAEQVSLVLNLDSRGNRGPAIMYQTSANAGGLVDIVSEFVSVPMATSLVNALFSKLPFASDLSSAFKHGKAGMNFAFVDGFNNYHAATDTPSRLSLDSLQHLGNFALPLVQHIGAIKLPIPLTPDRHYFNPLGKTLVSYSAWVDWATWLVAGCLILFVCIRAIKEGSFKLLQLFHGFGYAFLFALLPIFFVFLCDRLIDQVIDSQAILARQNQWFVFWAMLTLGASICLHAIIKKENSARNCLLTTSLLALITLAGGINYALITITAVLGFLLFLIMRKQLKAAPFYTGFLIYLWLLALVALLQLPGGAYILAWALLPITMLEAFRSLYPKRHTSIDRFRLIVGLPAFLLLGATALTFDLLVGYDFPFISVFPLVLILMFFEPLLNSKFALLCGAALVALAILIFIFLVLRSPWSSERPQQVSQFVLHDVNTEHSYWASKDTDLTTWHKTTLGSNPGISSTSIIQPGSDQPIWLASIKLRELTHSKLALPTLSQITLDNLKQKVSFRVKPGHAGDSISVWIEPGAEPLSWTVEGHSLALENGTLDQWHSLTGFALPAEGVVITLTLKQEKFWPKIRLTSVHNGLPKGLSLPARGNSQVRGSSHFYSDSTVTFETIDVSKL